LCIVQISNAKKICNILDFKFFNFQIWFQFSIIYIMCLCMVQCAISANVCFFFVFIGSLWNIICFCWFIVGHCLKFRIFLTIMKTYQDQGWYPLVLIFKNKINTIFILSLTFKVLISDLYLILSFQLHTRTIFIPLFHDTRHTKPIQYV